MQYDIKCLKFKDYNDSFRIIQEKQDYRRGLIRKANSEKPK